MKIVQYEIDHDTVIVLFVTRTNGLNFFVQFCWTVSDGTILKSGTLDTPKVAGRFTGLAPGTAVVSARYGALTKTATVTVTEAAVMGLTMTTENPEGECGVNQPQMV
ncbi:MAG: hypothetical protein EOP04_25295, partial [Proteobacteria bacterium]